MQTEIPTGWQAGHITVDGKQRPAMVKHAGGVLKVETEGELVVGQTFRAYAVEWAIVEVETRANNIVYAVCRPKEPGKPPFVPEYPKGAKA
jgi:hypothetical protein